MIESRRGDHPLGGLMRDNGRNAGPDLGNARVRGAADNVVQFAHAWCGLAKAKLAANRGRVPLIGRAVFNAAEIALPQWAMGGGTMTE